jgi:hypothetical protein
MALLEEITEKVHDAYFVDLFVRVSNQVGPAQPRAGGRRRGGYPPGGRPLVVFKLGVRGWWLPASIEEGGQQGRDSAGEAQHGPSGQALRLAWLETPPGPSLGRWPSKCTRALATACTEESSVGHSRPSQRRAAGHERGRHARQRGGGLYDAAGRRQQLCSLTPIDPHRPALHAASPRLLLG